MSNASTDERKEQDAEREQQDDKPAKDDGPPAPFAPDSDEDSALGDTDEHSDA